MRTLVVALATASIVTAANASEGAYFSQSWGWVALAFLIPTTLMLILGRSTVPGRLRIAFAVLMGALAAWIALSSLWSVGSAPALRETERMLVYVAFALSLAVVLRRGDAAGVAGGVLVGGALISAYSLATRLFPDWLETFDDPQLPYRLSEPLGYWNSLGLLAAMGFIVGLGVVAHGRSARVSMAAAAGLPILSVTLYFTFSRGAWAAIVVAFCTMVALDPRRLRLLWVAAVVTPASLLSVAAASRQNALTTEDAPAAAAVNEGHRLAVVVVALTACSVFLAWGAARIAKRVPISGRVRISVNALLVALVAAGCIGALVVAGGPVHGLSALKARFEAPPPAQIDLNARLFSFSGSGRSEQIAVAIDAGRERPLLGYGAGSYESLWYERRVPAYVIRDAHSLYAETFAELGTVGLALLCLALLAPVIAALRARRHRLVPAAAAAYVAWVVHSAMDWHWELVGVTLTAFFAGGAALLASERPRIEALTTRARVSVGGLSAVLTLFALVSLVGNQALFAGREAVSRGDGHAAVVHGRRAQALLFWSFEPNLVLGDAAALLGDREAALAAYRDAARAVPKNWVVWLRVAQVARGQERVHAYAMVRRLNPLEQNLPGAPAQRVSG